MSYDTTIRELSGTAARLGSTITQAARNAPWLAKKVD